MFELLLMVPDYVILSLTCWLELVLHLHCYTQWKRIIGSPVHPEDPKEVKIGQYRVFLLPATTASIKNPPQPHYQLSWCKATRTAHGEENPGSGPWEILSKWLGWWAPHHCWRKAVCTSANSTKEATPPKALYNTLHAHSRLALSITIVWWGWRAWKSSSELWVIK